MPFKEYWREQLKEGYPDLPEDQKDSAEARIRYIRKIHSIYADAAKDYMKSRINVIEGMFEGRDKAFTENIERLEKKDTVKLKGGN